MSELSELFARDPLGLTDADIDTIIARMREAQAQYELGTVAKGTVAKTPRPKPSAAAAKKASTAAELLNELGLNGVPKGTPNHGGSNG